MWVHCSVHNQSLRGCGLAGCCCKPSCDDQTRLCGDCWKSYYRCLLTTPSLPIARLQAKLAAAKPFCYAFTCCQLWWLVEHFGHFMYVPRLFFSAASINLCMPLASVMQVAHTCTSAACWGWGHKVLGVLGCLIAATLGAFRKVCFMFATRKLLCALRKGPFWLSASSFAAAAGAEQVGQWVTGASDHA